MDFPILRDRQKKTAAGLERTCDLLERESGVADMFQCDYVDRGIEAAIAKGQCAKIADGIQPGVVPRRVADREIHGDIALCEKRDLCRASPRPESKTRAPLGEAIGRRPAIRVRSVLRRRGCDRERTRGRRAARSVGVMRLASRSAPLRAPPPGLDGNARAFTE